MAIQFPDKGVVTGRIPKSSSTAAKLGSGAKQASGSGSGGPRQSERSVCVAPNTVRSRCFRLTSCGMERSFFGLAVKSRKFALAASVIAIGGEAACSSPEATSLLLSIMGTASTKDHSSSLSSDCSAKSAKRVDVIGARRGWCLGRGRLALPRWIGTVTHCFLGAGATRFPALIGGVTATGSTVS
uniref:Uncharacterized protein n=1 Tax=Hyaloperonospora arabidopsidis (strain Emoy2) TaxID=559515 RepID=M4C009_HYAAE